MTKKDEIPREKISELVWNTIGDSISVSDIGWWLECKTDDTYTTVERQFIIEAFEAIENCRTEIEKIENKFKEDWSASLATLRRKPCNPKHKKEG